MSSLLVNHLWQSTLFAGAIAALVLLLRNEAAHVRYWLWLAASIKFLVPFHVLVMLGGAFAEPVVLAPAPVPEWYVTIAKAAQPVSSAWWPVGLAFGLAALWASGVITVLVSWYRRSRQLAAVVRAARPGPSLRVERAGRRHLLHVRYSQALTEPGIVGVFRPVLLLPKGIGTRLDAEQLESVIEHELCHWRRRDNLTASVHMVVEALFWFHPLVWWIGGRLVEERERACDEAVVRAGHARDSYAEGLLNVCELYVARSLRCAAGMSGADLKARVTAIMRHRAGARLPARKKALLAAAALATVLAPVVAGFVTHGTAGTALAQEHVEEFLPIVRVAPEYPVEAAARGLEGHVVVQFTVTPNGTVEDVYVIEYSDPVFAEAAVRAAQRFRYRPRVVNGQAVEVSGVQNLFTFELGPREPEEPARE